MRAGGGGVVHGGGRGVVRGGLEGKLIGFWLFTLAVHPSVESQQSQPASHPSAALRVSAHSALLSLAAELAENECTSLISSLTWKLWYLSL